MTWLQFIAAVIHDVLSLAWPAALVMCVWLFRQQLSTLLPNLRLKHGDWEISFRLDEAARAVQKLGAPAKNGLPPTPEEKQRFEEIAKLSPRAAILEMRANLEEAVKRFFDAAGMKSPKAYINFGSLVRALRQNQLIDSTTSALIDDLRVVGNTTAHG